MPNCGAVNFRTSARRHRDNVSPPPEYHIHLTFSPHVTEQVECFVGMSATADRRQPRSRLTRRQSRALFTFRTSHLV